MDCKTALAQLESWGSAQTRKTYGRHGVKSPMYGVSFANLNKLAKQLKTDHELACALWRSGNHDARVLATIIADPARVDSTLADAWLKACDNAVIADLLASLISRAKLARRKADRWTRSVNECVGTCGWGVLARLAMVDASLGDAYFVKHLEFIEQRIHARPNRTRYAMNNALIAIGVRNPALRKLALAAARRIGKVEVDHGDTSCQTRDAAAYIHKTLAHRRAKKQPAKVESK